MFFSRLSRLFHTVRFLRFEQIRYRIYYRFRKLKLQPVIISSVRLWSFPWSAPAWQPSFLTESGEFVFLGEKGHVSSPVDWNNPHKSKLWLYNLHYLDELNTQGAETRASTIAGLIERWRSDNPPMEGNGWEPYPLSLRLVNLVKWYARKGAEQDDLKSLALQAQALASQIEYHILGNHLFANGKALVFVGAFLESTEGNEWLSQGLNILDREISEQFLADGGHFELSPMYHATLLWDMCDLVRLAETSGLSQLQSRKEIWCEVIKKGLDWLTAMVHPDGEISFFNDAAFGIAPRLEDLLGYAEQLNCHIDAKRQDGLSLHYLDASGYAVVNIGAEGKALLDVAEVGASYQPGHAHADTLSFEFSLAGQRLIVNSGTSQYGNDTERHRQRSTKAHSTVVVDGENSSEVWAGFRVARRAHPKDLVIEKNAKRLMVSAAHDGYKRLPGNVLHWRQWVFTENSFSLTDRITGKYKLAEARFYLHPDTHCTIVDNDYCLILLPGGMKVQVGISGSKYRIEETTWHAAFGDSLPNKCLVVPFVKNESVVRFEW